MGDAGDRLNNLERKVQRLEDGIGKYDKMLQTEPVAVAPESKLMLGVVDLEPKSGGELSANALNSSAKLCTSIGHPLSAAMKPAGRAWDVEGGITAHAL